jgi:hypothetical protein
MSVCYADTQGYMKAAAWWAFRWLDSSPHWLVSFDFPCAKSPWGCANFLAVVDDFGALVRVPR